MPGVLDMIGWTTALAVVIVECRCMSCAGKSTNVPYRTVTGHSAQGKDSQDRGLKQAKYRSQIGTQRSSSAFVKTDCVEGVASVGCHAGRPDAFKESTRLLFLDAAELHKCLSPQSHASTCVQHAPDPDKPVLLSPKRAYLSSRDAGLR